ncbi:unnamed protein product [Sphenostylis stenocarpa]|uniref:Uncharacterized protein n=1 Tax=Sphenostylis stenocarpa TaxID=92480 RepID=A0AA86S8J3_9FABA|nr:unnamed protein product [Sphenostylis stenocarpa]
MPLEFLHGNGRTELLLKNFNSLHYVSFHQQHNVGRGVLSEDAEAGQASPLRQHGGGCCLVGGIDAEAG